MQLDAYIPERYGQFQLVLEFLLEPSWTCQMVEKVIASRIDKAKSICSAYQYSYEYLKSSSDGDLLKVINFSENCNN